MMRDIYSLLLFSQINILWLTPKPAGREGIQRTHCQFVEKKAGKNTQMIITVAKQNPVGANKRFTNKRHKKHL